MAASPWGIAAMAGRPSPGPARVSSREPTIAPPAARARASSRMSQKPRHPQRWSQRGASDDSHGEPPFRAGPAGHPARASGPGQHRVGQAIGLAHGRLVVQPGSESSVEVEGGVHIDPPFDERQARVGIEGRAHLLGRTGESGLHGADRQADDVGGLLHRQSQVEVEHDERPLLGREPLEAARQLVLVRDGNTRIGADHRDRSDAALDVPPPLGRRRLRDSTHGPAADAAMRRTGRDHGAWRTSATRRRAPPGWRPRPARRPGGSGARWHRASRSKGVSALRTPRDRLPSLVRRGPGTSGLQLVRGRSGLAAHYERCRTGRVPEFAAAGSSGCLSRPLVRRDKDDIV